MAPLTIPDLLRDSSRRFGEHPAVVDESITISYQHLEALAHRVGRALLASGVEPGDRIAVWCPNRWEFVATLLGAQCIGASLVPLNTRYRGEEARSILERSRASVLVVANGFLGNDYLGMLHAGSDTHGLPGMRTVIDVAAEHTSPLALSWPDFMARAEVTSAATLAGVMAEVSPETVCDILYTSGTTGTPKGVLSSHRQTIGVARQWAAGARLTPTDRYAVVNPFFHSFGYKAGVLTALTAGTTIHPVPTFDAVDLMSRIERERISVLPGPPTLFITLINHPRLAEFDLSSLRFATAGATAVAETLFQDMLDVLGFDSVAQAYGLTECVLATQSRPDEDPRHVAETTGPAVPGIEIRIGADGEVLLRGEHVMRGYFEDPEATRQAIDADGWLHTGDVGRLDEHDCLTITDRIKDVVIVGGFNVYPAEVEKLLSRHPGVAECAVVGIPDERLGAVLRAYVVPRPGAVVREAELVAFARERIANFKVPREVVLVTDLPRNAAGKVLKGDLRAQVS
jgi:acyl-CoA synthetase (AMP-forming)/AMP-acid ligase II